jgi:nitrite reductase/ring-hydroxylating ferredoxin subunit
MHGEEKMWVPGVRASDLSPGHIAAVEVESHRIAIYNVAGEFFATANVCTHAFALLHEGYLVGDVIECPLHGGCFNVRSGEGLGAPIIHDLKVYATRVVNGEIQIKISS